MAKGPEQFLYTIGHGAESFIIRKWDKLAFECLSEYIMPLAHDEAGDLQVGCTCPQGLKPTCRHRKMLPRVRHILDVPGAFYRYGDDRFLGVFDGKLRPLTEQEEFTIINREPHPLSAEQPLEYGEDEAKDMRDGLERDELVGEAVGPSGSDVEAIPEQVAIASFDKGSQAEIQKAHEAAPPSRINRRGF